MPTSKSETAADNEVYPRLRAVLPDGSTFGPLQLFSQSPDFSLASTAMRWTYLVARRQQWSDAGRDVQDANAKAHDILSQLGVQDTDWNMLSRAKAIQVSVPWIREEVGWACRVLPWEFLIVLALRFRFPGLPSPTIVRHLDVVDATDAAPSGEPTLAVSVIACPNDKNYSATRERYLREAALVRDHLGQPQMQPLPEAEIDRWVESFSNRSGPVFEPVIHFLGVTEVRPNESTRRDLRPHLWIPGSTGWVEFGKAAELLTRSGHLQPRLITFSFRDTGPRLAARVVAEGAHAAIGFQDQVTSQVSESFYCLFYKHWRENGWDLLAAFATARRQLSSKLSGTGIVLWSRHSLIENQGQKAAPAAPAASDTHSSDTEFAPKPGRTRRGRGPKAAPVSDSPPAPPPPVSPLPPSPPPPLQPIPFPPPSPVVPCWSGSDGIVVTATAAPQLNYSVLHNQQGAEKLENLDPNSASAASSGAIAPLRLFSKFAIQRGPQLPADTAVEVEVTLYAGDDQCTWRQLEVLDTPSKDVSGKIRVPLTSTLARTLRENLRTTVESSVRWQGNIVHRMSHAVTLLAIDEWRDDGVCHVFLPSFVLPRDPAVIEVVRVARRCLCALTDDFSAGFDGYQQEDPACVDQQVRAIWASLVQEWQLGYINPPPSFSKSSQRLRPPSAILKERAGTCIDLALLLAACLEYIDIHPFIALCPGHAYVGYCRVDREPGERLIPMQAIAETEVPLDSESTHGLRPSTGTRILPPWVYDRVFQRAFVRELEEGRIVAIEATGLTRGLPFNEACRLGAVTLRKRLEFDCIIDVLGARAPGHDVSPLPMIFS